MNECVCECVCVHVHVCARVNLYTQLSCSHFCCYETVLREATLGRKGLFHLVPPGYSPSQQQDLKTASRPTSLVTVTHTEKRLHLLLLRLFGSLVMSRTQTQGMVPLPADCLLTPFHVNKMVPSQTGPPANVITTIPLSDRLPRRF